MCYLDAIALVRAHFGRGRGPIFLDDVRCNGSEIRIIDCPNKPNEHNCNHKEDAGVICTRKLDFHSFLLGMVRRGLTNVAS